MKELFLRPFFLGQELDVIHQQDVYVAEFVAEAGHLVVTQRVNHFIGKFLAGYVADGRLWHPPLDLVPDGLHQVGFAHSHAAV